MVHVVNPGMLYNVLSVVCVFVCVCVLPVRTTGCFQSLEKSLVTDTQVCDLKSNLVISEERHTYQYR